MIMKYDQCLRFSIDDKRISLIDEQAVEVVADNRNNICCKFECDEQWDDVAKVARFIYNGQWKDVVLDVDCMCYVPSEVIKEGRFSVGLYGDNLKASTPLVVTVLESILSENDGELPDAPTDDVYTQILVMTADANAKADAATEAAWAAVDASTEAIKALNQAKQEMEEAGFVNTLKEKHEGVKLGFWVGTQAEYDALENKPTDCYVLIEDDDTLEEIEDRLSASEASLQTHGKHIMKLFNQIKAGTYTGDGNPSQFINLGFTPAAVLVMRADGISNVNRGGYDGEFTGGLAIQGNPSKVGEYPIITIVENGFNVFHSEYGPGTSSEVRVLTNEAGSSFNYIAINLGGA